MFRILFIILTLLLVTACYNPNIPMGSISPPFVSNVVEDSSATKYFVSYASYNYKTSQGVTLYTWNNLLSQWQKNIILKNKDQSIVGTEIYPDLVNIPAKSLFFYNPYYKKRFELNLQTSQVTVKQFTNNYSIISADEFAVYTGSIVQLHQISNNSLTNLHSLPSVATVSNDLGLNLDTARYQMLCVPYMQYRQWDYQTHYCVIARDVRYDNDLRAIAVINTINDGYQINLTIQPNGTHTSTLLFADQQYRGIWYVSEVFFGNFMTDYSLYAYKDGCRYSVDTQKNMHEFCITDLAQPNVFTYSFYDKAAPTTPLYTQILP